MFWAPEALPSVLVARASGSDSAALTLVLADLASGDIRQASDGWHAVLRIDGVQHHLWFREEPQCATSCAVELPLDADFEARAHASYRLWHAINGRPPGPPFQPFSAQRRERMRLVLRALDGHRSGASYRAIAEVLFGRIRISERAWKTHELRSRTIRLVQAGVALIRGGYRALLRPPSRKD
ncbi:hypothetical protein AYJ54_37995 [Bradyrhizobium centrolobii]|uniref:T6SS Transcription factor RovC-like DNA binding domain-containing protein n=1 Tax=Bradyrhizobium centrolobii TaxID=1505087 RepID=A0A176Z9J0_9BRAD|nr:hypothetical protein AYJ54_37995 [Bradyrhizobium centrolobii]